MLRLAAALAALTVVLAGCAEEGAKPTDGTDPAVDDAAPQGPLTSIPAPSWEPGQWWEWETTFSDGSKGEPFRSIVFPFSDAGTYTLVTESDAVAKQAATYGHLLLSPVRAGDLAMSDWSDSPWSLLSFPLTDGKTWTATIPNVAWDIFLPATTVEATLTATFIEADGSQVLVGLAGDVGEHRVLDAVYDPASGWFRSLTFHDVDPGDMPLEISWTAKSAGLNYTGPYFDHEAKLLLAFGDYVGFDNLPTEGGQPYTAAPQPYHTFTMGEGTTLYGYVGAFSVVGARAVVLTDPANQQRNLATPGAPEGEGFLALDEPGQAGQWTLATAGAGGLSAAFAEIYELTLGQGTMGQPA